MKISYLITRVFVLTAILLFPQLSMSQGRSEAVFEKLHQKLPPQAAKRLHAMRNKTVARDNVMRMKLNLDRRTAAADRVKFSPFPEVDIEQKFRRIERRAKNYTWFGGDPKSQSHSMIVVQGTDMVGTIRDKGKLYQIRPLGNGSQAILEVDESRFVDHPPGAEKGLQPEGNVALDNVQLALTKRASRIFVTGPSSPSSIIRVLVAYTPAAAAQAGNIDGLIQLAIDETNQTYQNSGLGSIVEVQLASAVQTNYTESNSFVTDVIRLAGPSDGYMDELHGLRTSSSADAVVLLRKTGEYCGIGYLNSSAPYAFSVTANNCATGYYSFGHELGHNIGLNHDPYVTGSSGYNHGFVNLSGRWRTIMGYNSQCVASGYNCTRIQWISNPSISYSGAVTGTSTTHDNARVMSERSPAFAAFR